MKRMDLKCTLCSGEVLYYMSDYSTQKRIDYETKDVTCKSCGKLARTYYEENDRKSGSTMWFEWIEIRRQLPLMLEVLV